jgi:hypothetical protein
MITLSYEQIKETQDDELAGRMGTVQWYMRINPYRNREASARNRNYMVLSHSLLPALDGRKYPGKIEVDAAVDMVFEEDK